MDKNKLQLRHISAGLQVREGEGDNESRTIVGHAIITGVETTLYEDDDYREIEIINKSCLKEDFLKDQDIKLNLLHEREYTIARNNKGNGNLSYEVREDGLHFEVEAPKCDIGDRALELVRAGVYTGCSFEFYPEEHSIDVREGKDGKQEYVIEHTKFRSLSALTIALDPAYEQTSVNLREEYRRKCKTKEDEDEEDKPEDDDEKKKDECKKKKNRERALFLMTIDNDY